MRISSPPTTYRCFYGIDTPERGKLLAANHDTEEMARLIGADSLAFISLDGLYRALGRPEGRNPVQPFYCSPRRGDAGGRPLRAAAAGPGDARQRQPRQRSCHRAGAVAAGCRPC